MKIGTDGVLLGAWAAIAQAPSLLDIGTGTGVLALMAAQRNSNAKIDAIEIEPRAFIQAKKNISAAIWKDRINIFASSLQNFNPSCNYHSIISNPPYFDKNKSSKTKNKARDIARTTDSLPFNELLEHTARLLHPKGNFSMIIPYQEGQNIINIAPLYGLYPSQIVEISPRVGKPTNRLLLEFTKTKTKPIRSQLAIRNAGKEQRDYTKEFISLHQDFLLFL